MYINDLIWIVIGLLSLLSIPLIYLYIESRKKKIEEHEQDLRELISDYITLFIWEDNTLDKITMVPTYELFKLYLIDYFEYHLLEDERDHLKDIDKTYLHRKIKEELQSDFIDKELSDLYYSFINDRVKEGIEEEKKAEIYHKSFGVEPTGSPELHPNEKREEMDTPDHYSSLDELIQTGTVEDL